MKRLRVVAVAIVALTLWLSGLSAKPASADWGDLAYQWFSIT